MTFEFERFKVKWNESGEKFGNRIRKRANELLEQGCEIISVSEAYASPFTIFYLKPREES